MPDDQVFFASTLLVYIRMLNKGVDWSWTIEREKAFKHAKTLLTSNNVLIHYDSQKALVLACDASAYHHTTNHHWSVTCRAPSELPTTKSFGLTKTRSSSSYWKTTIQTTILLKHRYREFQSGEPVFVQNFGKGSKWIAGKIDVPYGNVSYDVTLDDGRTFEKGSILSLLSIFRTTPR